MMEFFEKINHKKLLIFFFLNVFLFPIYPFNLRPTLIVLLLVCSIFYSTKRKIKFSLKFNKSNESFYLNISFYIILVIGLLYSKNTSAAISTLFRMLPLFIFPIIFKCIYDERHISEKLILKAYSFFYLSTVLLFLSFLVYFYFNGKITVNFLRNYNERITNLLGRYSIHPLYASIYISTALILSVKLLKKRYFNGSIIFFVNTLLTLNLILLARKSTIIIMFIFFVVYQLIFQKNRITKSLLFIFLVIILGITIFIFVPDISYRFKDLTNFIENPNGSIGLRVNTLKCGFNSIFQNPILGYGIGDVEDVLNECYRSFPEIFNGKYYNSHNQYIGIWLSSGLLGFIGLIAMLVHSFLISIKFKNLESFAILLLFSFMMFIENILERQDGVLIFALFINLFSFTNQTKKSEVQ